MTAFPKVYLRADGSTTIGLGHLSRLAALAQMLQNHFPITFLLKKGMDSFAQQLTSIVDEIITIPDFENGAIEEAIFLQHIIRQNDLVVLDGYHFDTAYQSQIKAAGCKLVCIDDIHNCHFVADIIINHAAGVHKEEYSFESYTRLYLGTRYMLLKKEFLEKAQTPRHPIDFASSPVLICLGGADPGNVTMKILQEIKHLFPERDILVVVGAAYQYKDSLLTASKTTPRIALFTNIPSAELIDLMEKAHIAITSASTIALEYICIKGNLFLIQTASNQSDIYKSLIEKNYARPYEQLAYYFNRHDTIEVQNEFIDGKSGERILGIITNLFND